MCRLLERGCLGRVKHQVRLIRQGSSEARHRLARLARGLDRPNRPGALASLRQESRSRAARVQNGDRYSARRLHRPKQGAHNCCGMVRNMAGRLWHSPACHGAAGTGTHPQNHHGVRAISTPVPIPASLATELSAYIAQYGRHETLLIGANGRQLSPWAIASIVQRS
jgi:hypothetical protein